MNRYRFLVPVEGTSANIAIEIHADTETEARAACALIWVLAEGVEPAVELL